MMLELAGPAISLAPVQRRYLAAFARKVDEGVYGVEEVARCACGVADAEPVAAHDRFGFPVRVVMCRSCGLVWSGLRLTGSAVPAFYRDDYHGLHLGLPEPDPDSALFRRGQGGLIYRYLRDLLPAGDLTVIEVGCATGTVLREFSGAAATGGRSVRIIGCEYAPAYVEAGRRRGTEIRLGGVETLEGAPKAHLLILSHVVEHFYDLDAPLRTLRRHLHPEGLVYVEVPGLLHIHRKPEYRFALRPYLTLAHTYHFSLATLTAVMERAGFRRLRGDEYVRSVFAAAPGPAGAAPGATPDVAMRTRAYLRWLDRSAGLRACRALMTPLWLGRRLARAVRGRLSGRGRMPRG